MSIRILIMMSCVFLLPRATAAAFADAETAAANGMRAGAVDLAVIAQSPAVGANFAVGQTATGTATVRNAGSMAVAPTVSVVAEDGSAAACAPFVLTLTADGDVRFTGAFADLHDAALDVVASGASVTLGLDVTLPAASSAAGVCVFRVDVAATRGFGDTETLDGYRITPRDVTPPPIPRVHGWNTGNGSAAPAEMPTDLQCGAATNADRIAPVWSDERAGGAVTYLWEVTAPDAAVTAGNGDGLASAWIATDGREGTWTVRVRARDAAGNLSDWSASCMLVTDYTPPLPAGEIGFLWPHPDSKGTHNGITFAWDTDEAARAAVYYDLTPADPYDQGTYAAVAVTSPGVFTSAPRVFVPFPGPGSFAYIITMTDAALNETVLGPGIFNVPSDPSPETIVLNEIMANPVGSDDAAMPHGEWVELHNRGAFAVDVAGWRIRDASGGTWVIATSRGDNDGVPTVPGETVVPPGGYLVVYRAGAGMSINNSGSETISLTDSGGSVHDSHTFDVGASGEGKSVARFPDGVGVWIDPEPTPGGDNTLGTAERDMLRRQTFATCFERGAQLVRHEAGTLCDPVFLTYLGMLADEDATLLARPELLVPETLPMPDPDVPQPPVPLPEADPQAKEELPVEIPPTVAPPVDPEQGNAQSEERAEGMPQGTILQEAVSDAAAPVAIVPDSAIQDDSSGNADLQPHEDVTSTPDNATVGEDVVKEKTVTQERDRSGEDPEPEHAQETVSAAAEEEDDEKDDDNQAAPEEEDRPSEEPSEDDIDKNTDV